MKTRPQASMTPARRGRALRGILLPEVLVYLGGLFVVTGVASMAFLRTLDHSRTIRRVADDITRALAVGESWRADVRATSEVPWQERTATNEILHLPQGETTVAYRFDGGQVWRRGQPTGSWTLALTGVQSSMVVHDAADPVPSWRWELELAASRHDSRIHPMFSFTAVSAPEVHP